MPWYEEWFDREEYELVYPHRNMAEAARCVDLIERVVQPAEGAEILDVACGRGRHARVLARRGYRVTGIDLSSRAVAAARERAEAEGLDVTFEQQDMREAYCAGCADGVVNLFSSFGYFEREEDHREAIKAMATALYSGGWLVQDFMNAPYVTSTLIPEDARTEGDIEIHQRRWIDAGRINKEITLRRDGRQRTFRESVRLLTLDDFRRLYAAAGLKLVQTFGGYDGRPHTDGAPRLILHARKG